MHVPADLAGLAEAALARNRVIGRMIATAESCTGGLVAALLTSIAGSSDVFERGFVTYSNEAKSQELGVPASLIVRAGAVSAEVAAAMATGAIVHSRAEIAVSVTGIAGPGGGSATKPVGLVYLALAVRGKGVIDAAELRLGDIGREAIRNETARRALQLLGGAKI
jgi:nicotinamide-nucleotide amidase